MNALAAGLHSSARGDEVDRRSREGAVMDRGGNGSAVGAVVGATYRLVSAPVRVVANGADVPRRLQEAAVDAVTTPAAEKTLDELFAGPLPELIGRSLGEHRVVERVAGAALERTELEVDVKAVLESERVERAVAELLAINAFAQILEHVAASPQLRAALARQSSSLASETAAALRRRAVGLDARAEAAPRRWLRRPARSLPPYAGIVTRGFALAVDAGIATLVYLIGAALVALVSSLVGDVRPAWLVATIAGAAWFLVLTTYFVAFWSSIGQTPGMRIMRLRVQTRANAPPGFGRSLVRLVGLALAIIPCLAGFLPALVDERRRGLHDFLADTIVVYDP
jgi:uncharacterized RDD family membrane protein YckC